MTKTKPIEKKEKFLSDCCRSDFDAFGFPKDDGLWQEKCLECGKPCEPIYQTKPLPLKKFEEEPIPEEPKPIKESWEDSFEELFMREFYGMLQSKLDPTTTPGVKTGMIYATIKAFIRKTLKQEIARVGEEIVGKNGATNSGLEFVDIPNTYLNMLKEQQRKHLQEILKAL